MSPEFSYSKLLLTAVVALAAATLGAAGVAVGLGLLPAEVFLYGIAVAAGITVFLSLPLIFTFAKNCLSTLHEWRSQRSERFRREMVNHDFRTRFDVLASRLEKLTSTSYSMGIGSLLNPLVDAGVIDHAVRQAHYVHLMTINSGLAEIRNRLSAKFLNTAETANYLAVHIAAYLSICRQVCDSALAYANSDFAIDVDTETSRRINRLRENWSEVRDEVNRLTQEFSSTADAINGYLKTDVVRSYFERIEGWPERLH